MQNVDANKQSRQVQKREDPKYRQGLDGPTLLSNFRTFSPLSHSQNRQFASARRRRSRRRRTRRRRRRGGTHCAASKQPLSSLFVLFVCSFVLLIVCLLVYLFVCLFVLHPICSALLDDLVPSLSATGKLASVVIYGSSPRGWASPSHSSLANSIPA